MRKVLFVEETLSSIEKSTLMLRHAFTLTRSSSLWPTRPKPKNTVGSDKSIKKILKK